MKGKKYLVCFLLFLPMLAGAQKEPIKLGVAGLSHGHVGWILGRQGSSDIKMVGIVETDTALINRLSSQFRF